MKEILLSGKNISKSFVGQHVKENVLDQINVDIYQGDFTIIMGASGAGKSTLLYALSGMDEITSGKVQYRGNEISSFSEKKFSQQSKGILAFLRRWVIFPDNCD